MTGSIRFEPMAAVIPASSRGKAEVIHLRVDERQSNATKIRAWATRRPTEFVPPGVYAQLRVGGTVMMSDTPMEMGTNVEVVYRATGNVLIAGLGLGMILLPILRKPAVQLVTVVEQSADVVALVADPIRRAAGEDGTKLVVRQADIFRWRTTQQYDVVYFDIWPSMCGTNVAEMDALRARFAPNLKPGGWVGCWREADCRRED